MKKGLILLTLLYTIAGKGQQQEIISAVTIKDAKALQPLVITPLKPLPGSVINIRYNPRNTILSGVKDPEATAYLLEEGHPLAIEIPLREDNGVFTGKFRTNETTKAIFISFSKVLGPEQLMDNNEDKGYYTALYDGSGKEVTGANNALALGFGLYNTIWRMKRNPELALILSKKEFASAKSRTKFYIDYFNYLGRTGKEADKELLKKELKKQIAKKNISETDMEKIKNIYENVLKDKDEANTVLLSIKKKFPYGKWRIEEFFNEKDRVKRAILFDKLLNAFPGDKEYQVRINQMAQAMAQDFADSADYARMEQYIVYIKEKPRLAGFYNHFSAILSGGGITKKPINLAKSLEFSKKALAIMEEEMKNPTSKPTYLTPKQYLARQNFTYHSYRNIYALALYHNNEIEKAYELQKQAVDVFNGNNLFMNEAYALVTEKVKGPSAAQKELERFISEGKANVAMKNQLKEIYLKNHSEAQFAHYIQQLETATFNKLKAELSKKMIRIPAPQFSLKNLSGETVSLNSLKGKVVVVDFWSMWCGPCKASFPAMQKAVEKYKNRPDVAFLFIDTWSTGEEREQDVTGFIKDNKYPFNVLYDEARMGNPGDFIVVSDFKVTGIPTKFVIDKNNNIRFRSSGYNGSADGLINEITAMIELADAASETQ